MQNELRQLYFMIAIVIVAALTILFVACYALQSYSASDQHSIAAFWYAEKAENIERNR